MSLAKESLPVPCYTPSVCLPAIPSTAPGAILVMFRCPVLKKLLPLAVIAAALTLPSAAKADGLGITIGPNGIQFNMDSPTATDPAPEWS